MSATQRIEDRKEAGEFSALQTINLRARRAQTYRGRQNYGWQNYRSLGKRGVLTPVVLLPYDREENKEQLKNNFRVSASVIR